MAQLMKTVGCLLGTYLLVQSTVSVQPFQYYLYRRRITTKEEAKVVAVWGTELIQFLAALDISTRMILKKRVNRIKAAWRNGCFEKMDDHLVYTIPNHHPTKMVLSQKLLFKSSLLLIGYSTAFK